ncbi:hypothetical protein JGS39_24060 [Streptomyces sp. P01-B04]|uniref:hypothetical protein n=1 Tax=Streptomyces poriferorum TaxID=2798799 RepID=UPI001C5CD717|nr:hypothetical protein [Streptomyces poriferorum]MBW5252037.1 hypothetical protein [Streptomyces poriferorum]MBW5260207.1 hypothetical protein [Streptomyces poriferorum]
MKMGRPAKGLTERILLRLSDEERWMAESLATELQCSLNDALRICVRRGYGKVGPSREVDGPVLEPDFKPAPLTSVPKIQGQTAIDIDEDSTEAPE